MNWRGLMTWLRDPEGVTAEIVAERERNAFAVGYAQGELSGRMQLAAELEQRFGVGGGSDEFTALDAATLRVRQVH